MNKQLAIYTEELTKDYGVGRGLFDLNLEVAQGEVFGFLGPNGAGKTTAIKLFMGLSYATSGTASIFGLDVRDKAVEIKRTVGYVPGELPQFGGLRASEVVAWLGGLRGTLDGTVVTQIAQRLSLDLSRRFREYSRGNKQKLAILLGFMHKPRLLIMDEPTGGLDPLVQQEFNSMVREASHDGATVFLSSHILSEVESLCDRVGIIRGGHLVRVEGLDAIRQLQVRQVEIDFLSTPPVEAIKAAVGVEDVSAFNTNRVTCSVHGSFDGLLASISGHGVLNLVSREPSLEEVFLLHYRDEATASAN